jgi:nucleotide-binding universal stress UspA family protein
MVAPIAETIVVGIDGSECSEQALRWAIDEARMSGRTLLLIHVWHWRTDAVASPMSLVGTSDARQAGHHLLGRAAAQARRCGVTVATRLVEGSAPTALASVAEGAAMLVVGSHGHRGMGKLLFGSVSRGCIQHARCPVVVMPAQSSAPQVHQAAGAHAR